MCCDSLFLKRNFLIGFGHEVRNTVIFRPFMSTVICLSPAVAGVLHLADTKMAESLKLSRRPKP